MTTITIDEARYGGALSYAKEHNTSIQQLVDDFLSSLYIQKKPARKRREIPDRVRALRGAFRDVVPDSSDDRMMYILGKGDETGLS